MSDSIGEELKKLVLAGIGAAAVTAEKASDLVEELVKKGELTVEQGKVLNEELKHTIKKTVREKCAEEKTAEKTEEKAEEKTKPEKASAQSILDQLDGLSDEDLEAVQAKLARMLKDKTEKDKPAAPESEYEGT